MNSSVKMWHPSNPNGDPVIVIASQINNMKQNGWVTKNPNKPTPKTSK